MFMPKKPETMVIGNASTVTMVSVKSVRLVCSLTSANTSSCSSLMRSTSVNWSGARDVRLPERSRCCDSQRRDA